MIDVAAIIDDDGNLLFDETTGSSSFDNELGIYDSLTGKYYRTLFDLEEAFYESKMYAAGDLPNPPDIKPLKFEPVKMCYTPTTVNIVGLMSSVTPTFYQRLDGTWTTTFNNAPIPIYDLEF